ncbi:MAG: hypothetical protein KJ718_04110 [Nanoarchaeota archaeon]|nr:hypothetical protein [Nanoarchaeota archaeon]MBU1051713.1 hypothetical protein [Nanoarchaeota archaeon]MBU1988290.1 hypothetical protein [Nanoarchaeota archaeon]
MTNKKTEDLPACCQPKKDKEGNIKQGLIYGLIPHIGCIAFIIGSVLGVTVLMQFFKPILMNRYFFHALMGVSIGFATLSSVIYLKKHKLLNKEGIKKKKSYLFGMYGSTIGINLVLFLVIFPMLANVGATGNAIANLDYGGLPLMELSVDIPCPGHAPLITSELKTIQGVEDVRFNFPNDLEVLFDPDLTSKEDILALEVFEEYPATVTREPTTLGESSGGVGDGGVKQVQPLAAGSSGGSCGSPTCGGGSSCGGGCGGGCGG